MPSDVIQFVFVVLISLEDGLFLLWAALLSEKVAMLKRLPHL